MFHHELIVQSPGNRGATIAGVEAVASGGSFDRLRAAFAFASVPGAQEFVDALVFGAGLTWTTVDKRWLVSADFGFTEPEALEFLALLPASQVRVPDASYLIRNGLRPRVTHHAKGLVLDRRDTPAGRGPLAMFVGSANLTASALYDNFEYATVSVWTGPQAGAARRQLLEVRTEAAQFDAVWRDAEPLDADLLARYSRARRRARQRRRWPDPERPAAVRRVSQQRAAPLERAAAFRASSHFWIDTGNMYANLSGGRSNQLDMQAGSRVFFGFSNRPLNPETQIGSIALAYRSGTPEARNVWYGDNSMDKLYLPPPGAAGAPASYVNEVVMFERRRDGSFRFRIGNTRQVAEWKQRSRQAGTLYRMQSRREFGVFRL